MYMKDVKSGNLVEVLDMTALINPSNNVVLGRFHVGEELPEQQSFAKSTLIFPSGEALPSCWQNPEYKS